MKPWSISLTLATVILAAVPVAAQAPSVEVIATGLDSPRGLAIGEDGAVYVAEAGHAGNTCLLDIPGRGRTCVGASGAVARVTTGTIERIAEGLPSISTGGGIVGPADVAFTDSGDLYVITNLAGHPDDRTLMPEEVGSLAGWLIRVGDDGSHEPIADIAAFEAAEDPDGDASSGEVFSNPQSVAATGDGFVAIDAGGNSLLDVDMEGRVSLDAVFPPLTMSFTADELAGATQEGDGTGVVGARASPSATADDRVTVPVQAVPTSVAIGSDGAAYVGQLVGSPYPTGQASVWRVDGGVPEPYASGFSNIIDLAFGPDDTLYVAQLSSENLRNVFEGQLAPAGAIWSVPPDGGDPVLLISDQRVAALGGLAVDADGSIYVSTGSLVPGGGSVVRIVP